MTNERIDEFIREVGCGGCDSTADPIGEPNAFRFLGLCYECVHRLARLVEAEAQKEATA